MSTAPAFTHLHVHTPFSLLNAGSSIEALVKRAASFGMTALAVTDSDTLGGAVRFVQACQDYGIKPIIGAEVTLDDGSTLTLIAKNRSGYATLCKLLTRSYEVGGRQSPALPWAELSAYTTDLLCLTGKPSGRIPTLVRTGRHDEALELLQKLASWFGPDNLYLELVQDLTPGAFRVCRTLAAFSASLGLNVVATNAVHFAAKEDALTHEVVRCIATKTTADGLHPDRVLNVQRHLKSPKEMAALFAWCPQAIAATKEIEGVCELALPIDEDITPRYPLPEGFADADSYLRHLVYKGAAARYGTKNGKVAANVRRRLEHELKIIKELGYANYFLMVWQIVTWAKRQKIKCCGRGSAADSCVAFCLFLTDVDVMESGLAFSRFLTKDRKPDIDVDFDNTRRDEVIQYVIDTFGRPYVAMVCAWHTFQAKSAIRDVGKVLQIAPELLEFLSDNLCHFISADGIEGAFSRLPELKDHQYLKERCRTLFSICATIADFPRHIAMHSSGVLVSRVPLDTLAPLQPSAGGLLPILHLDKDDVEVVGGMKFDMLCLGILAAAAYAEKNIQAKDPTFRYDKIKYDDQATYQMLQAGNAIGVFQFESAAQIALALRVTNTLIRHLKDAVALIRPGPVRGDAVKRYVAVRNGWARPFYAHSCLYPILKRTLGIIVFQEQVISVLAVMMGVSEREADKFRKRFKNHERDGTMDQAKADFLQKALATHPDLSVERAELLFGWTSSWGGYGFVEGHAEAFAQTGFKTAFMSCHHPAEYFAGLLSAQPMGYYPPNSLAAEARRRGVQILGVDVNESRVESFAPDETSIRLGFGLVAELTSEDREAIVAARGGKPYVSLLDFCVRVPMAIHRVENLIHAGAFDRLHSNRRGLLWRLEETLGLALLYRSEAKRDGQGRLDFGGIESVETPCADIPDLTPWELFRWTWLITGVSVESHVFAWLRQYLSPRKVLSTEEAKRARPGEVVTICGLNVMPHRPPTKSGEPILYSTIEDETGVMQVSVAGQAILECTGAFLSSPAVLVRGVVRQLGRGKSIQVLKAKPFYLEQFVPTEELASGAMRLPDTPGRTYPGTKLTDRREPTAVS